MTRPLLDKSGRIVGACDEGLPFNALGRRPWRPRARPAAVAVDRAPIMADIDVEIDMQSAIPGYGRLP